MRIRQLGNGGAFHFKQTNTSFLIELDNKKLLLFDCGRNVIDKLDLLSDAKEFNYSDLKYVYISHMDDDHMGSLKTLIYYMFFSVGKKLQIITNDKVANELSAYLKDLNGFYENGNKINEQLFNFIVLVNDAYMDIDGGAQIKSLKADHHVACMGLCLKDKTGDIYLPGDSTQVFQNVSATHKARVVFQDFSLWDNIGSQVHCCKSRFMDEKLVRYFDNYNSAGIEIRSLYRDVKFCHTGLEFNDKWMTIEEASNMEDPTMMEIKYSFEQKFEKDKDILLSKIKRG